MYDFGCDSVWKHERSRYITRSVLTLCFWTLIVKTVYRKRNKLLLCNVVGTKGSQRFRRNYIKGRAAAAAAAGVFLFSSTFCSLRSSGRIWNLPADSGETSVAAEEGKEHEKKKPKLNRTIFRNELLMRESINRRSREYGGTGRPPRCSGEGLPPGLRPRALARISGKPAYRHPRFYSFFFFW